MRQYSGEVSLADDLDFKHLILGIQTHIQYFEKKDFNSKLRFGPREITVGEYVDALKYIIRGQYPEQVDNILFYKKLNEVFDIFEVYGGKDWGDVFITSYFDPEIEGSIVKTERFSEPLFRTPEDLVSINMGAFIEAFPKLKPIEKNVIEQKSRDRVVRGRLIKSSTATQYKVVPYYDREQMDSKLVLASLKDQIIVWVDPIDAFFLQIQGSGRVRLADGKSIKVGYAAQNGHPYVAIGRFLLDKIPREEMSLQKIESHLRSLSEVEYREILNKNPSYVFFQKLDTKSLTFMGTEVIEGRTIATDYSYFPKGALGYIEYEKPIYENEHEPPAKWVKSSRFIIDQDTGGAIRGPHRLDLYWGSGDEAKKVAGVMRNPGRLYYFVPKIKKEKL